MLLQRQEKERLCRLFGGLSVSEVMWIPHRETFPKTISLIKHKEGD